MNNTPPPFMEKLFYLLMLSCLVSFSSLFGQTNFRKGFQQFDPVHPDSNYTQEEKISLHQEFLDQAVLKKDQLQQLYGYLYLFYDYLHAYDYTEAAHFQLEAEQVASTANKPGWLGWARHRKGILFLRLDKEKESIQAYEAAAELCKQAGDSLCVGESLEQISAMFAQLGEFDQAQKYFDQALPLIEKFGDKKQLSATINNFGIMLSQKGQAQKAIPFIEQAMIINREAGYSMEEAKGLNNLADAYYRLGQTKRAIETWEKCIDFNQTNGFMENMITNYMGLYLIYNGRGNYKLALEHLINHIDLRDSIIGIKTQERIAKLEAKFDAQQKELALQQSQAELAATRQKLERAAAVFLIIVIFLIGGIWYWRLQNRLAKQELEQNRENLNRMIRLLLKKNQKLSELEEQLTSFKFSDQEPTTSTGLEKNLYNQRILTKEDWISFKSYFEKSYPGYLFKLRKAFPSLSEAEERLFLFIKLNLTRKETAAILGISENSVKRTRNRLRKRLELEPEASLDDFIHQF